MRESFRPKQPTAGRKTCVHSGFVIKHSATATRTYNSVNEGREGLLSFGIAEEVLNEYLKLLPQLGTGEHLKFPPADVPHHDLVAEGFKLSIG